MKGRCLTRLVLLVGVALAVASVGFACSDREAGQTTRKAQQHDGVSGMESPSGGAPEAMASETGDMPGDQSMAAASTGAPPETNAGGRLTAGLGAAASREDLPLPTVEELLEDGLHLAGASPVHLAVRGTAGAAMVRCAWRGIARTAAQREDAIRFWLQLDATDAIPDADYLGALFEATLDVINPEYRETAKSNFLAIARGGLSEEYLFLTCFADYAVTSYSARRGADDGGGGVRPAG